MNRQSLRAGARLVALFCLAASASAQEWTRFRGPNGAGVGTNATVPVAWTADDFNWRVELPGVGHASPVLWGDRVFLVSGEEETGARIVVCLDADDGEPRWSRRFDEDKHRKHQLNSFASSTPAVDRRGLYLCWATPERVTVLSLDHDGGERWRADLGPFRSGHGFGVSPIVWEDLLIVGSDHEGQSAVFALDVETGAIRWRTPRETRVAYATPCLYQPRGRPAELIFTNWEYGILAVDPATGRTNWARQVFDQSHVETSIGSPVIAGDLILGSCGWLGVATHTAAVRPGGDPPGTLQEVYRIDRGAPLSTTPLVVGGLLILWADNGIVTAADVATGDVLWRERVGGKYYSSPVAVGDAVYGLSTDGEAVVIAADRSYRLLARNPLLEGSHSTPAIARGRMYLRTFSHLISLGGGAGE